MIEVLRGNHKVIGINGRREECGGLVCLHAPLRSRASLDAKAEQGRRLGETGVPQDSAWNHRRWARLQDEGKLDDDWAANSHENGALDVYGERRELVWDHRLHDAVAPHGPGKRHRRASLLRCIARRL